MHEWELTVNLRKPNLKLILGKDENPLGLYHTVLKNLNIGGVRAGGWGMGGVGRGGLKEG